MNQIQYILYSAASHIPEFQRIAFTRIRTSSHRLRVETGRWTRPQNPRENRLCLCNSDVQTESHVLLECPLTAHIRNQYNTISNDTDISVILELNSENSYSITKMCADVLSYFADR